MMLRHLMLGSLVLLALVSAPWRAVVLALPVLVEQNGSQDTTSDATWDTTLADITAGNLLVAVIGYTLRTATINSVADDCGNTYTNAITNPDTDDNIVAAIYYKENAVGSATTCTLTLTISANNTNKNVRVSEWSGMATASALDQVNEAEEDGVVTPWPYPTTPPSITTTTASQVVIAAVMATANQNPYSTPTNSFTLFTLVGQRLGPSYRIVSSTGTYSTSNTGTQNGGDVSVIASFKAAATGGCYRTLLGVGC